MKTDSKDIEKFFETLGEIWRDICLIEFLMRCALAQKSGDSDKFPKPPYTKNKVYEQYPTSFGLHSFGNVASRFNKEFPELAIPQELIDLRNAMAHGLVAKINHSGVDELIKFRKQRDDTLKIEFNMTLEKMKIEAIRKSLHNLRKHIAVEASDK